MSHDLHGFRPPSSGPRLSDIWQPRQVVTFGQGMAPKTPGAM
jgi:hypothetical protein